MATAEELTDPHVSIYVPPPRAGRGVCTVCHGSSGQYARCWSCNKTRGLVQHAVGLVVPISLTRTDMEAQLHTCSGTTSTPTTPPSARGTGCTSPRFSP